MFQWAPNHSFPQKRNLNRQQQNYNNVYTFVVVTPHLSDFHQSDSQLRESTKATPSCVSPPKRLPVVWIHQSDSQLCQSTKATPGVRIHQGDSQLCESTKANSSCTSPSKHLPSLTQHPCKVSQLLRCSLLLFRLVYLTRCQCVCMHNVVLISSSNQKKGSWIF